MKKMLLVLFLGLFAGVVVTDVMAGCGRACKLAKKENADDDGES
jgi:hypothetical protein